MKAKHSKVSTEQKREVLFWESKNAFLPINRFRYYLYRLTDINPNRGRFSIFLVTSLIYNIIISLLPVIAIVPIIINFAVTPTDMHDLDQFNKFNNMMAKYLYIEFVFCFILLLDWIIRIIYADYKFPFVTNRWKSIFVYLTRFTNLYQFVSVIILIVLFSVYGHISNHNWWIDSNVLGSNYPPTSGSSQTTIAQELYNRWNPGELIFVSLYIANIFGLIPKLVTAFKDQTVIVSKTGLWSIIRKRWKTPVVATVFLIVLFIVFSFLILKTEQSYYSEWQATHPGQSLDDAPNYSSSPKNVWQSLWYCLITMTTVGYGQIIPQSPAGRVIAVFLIVIGISYYSFYTVFFVSIYTKFLDKKDEEIQAQEQEQQKIEDRKNLINDMKEQLINELVKYGVINDVTFNKVKYEENQKELEQQRLASQKANSANKNVVNIQSVAKIEQKRLKSWLNKSPLNINISKNKTISITNDMLSDEFHYKIANDPNLNANWQDILVKLDDDIIENIFTNDKEKQANLFFKEIAPSYKVRKVILVNKTTNNIIGEVILENILTAPVDVAWKEFGLESKMLKNFYDLEYSKEVITCIYLIAARKKYEEAIPVPEIEQNLATKLNNSFLYLRAN